MSTMPTRVDGDLFADAKRTVAAASRSASQQINHWARIGRAFEASPGVSRRDVQRVLAGEGSYDDLGEREQAIVRVAWDEQMSQRRDRLDLAAEPTWPAWTPRGTSLLNSYARGGLC